jgi:hypothetical protein
LLDVVGSEVVEEPPALAEQDRDQESDVVRRFEAE